MKRAAGDVIVINLFLSFPAFLLSLLILIPSALLGLPSPSVAQKPVPRMQAVPLPNDEVAFERDGREIARYHYGSELRLPFVFPVLGPAGRALTRLGHPHD